MSQIFIFIFIFSFFTSLFSLYILSHEDYVLIRKNINMEKLFNLAILASLAGFLSARILFVVFNFDQKFLNPFNFIAFPYAPGLSFGGGVLGGILFLLFYTKKEKMPVLRIFDFFLISFFSVFPLSFLIAYLPNLLKRNFLSKELYFLIIYIISLVIFTKLLLPRMQRGELKEGSLGFLVIIFFSVISLAYNVFPFKNFINMLAAENFILIFLLLSSFISFLKKGNLSVIKK